MCVAHDNGSAKLLGLTIRLLAGQLRPGDLAMRSMTALSVSTGLKAS